MLSEFWALGPIIKLDFPAPPRSLQVLHWPAGYHPKQSRVIFHETVHFWQYLASGYLARLVEEDWDRLVKFEDSGRVIWNTPLRSHFIEPHSVHAFSPRDLVEAFARYWDVHVVGPPQLIELELQSAGHSFSCDFVERFERMKRENLASHPQHGAYSSASFDLAMEGPGGGWAKPYVMMLERLTPKAVATLFPICINLALQTANPVGTFTFLISGAPSIENALPSNNDIAILWRWGYDFMLPLLQELPRQDLLGNGIQVASEGSLTGHPVWKWLIGYTLRAAAHFGITDGDKRNWETAVQNGLGPLSFALACPGALSNRSKLVPFLSPPLVQFADGVAWSLAKDAAISVQTSSRGLTVLDEIAEVAQDIDDRWQSLLDTRGY